MENFQRNKIIGDVFGRYLKKKFEKRYKIIEPKKKYVPDVDLILILSGLGNLFLQLKQVIEWKKTLKTPKGTKGFIFKGCLFEKTIEKVESLYCKRDNDISNRILIMHSGLKDYFIPSDMLLIDTGKFKKSNFKGIYIVSSEFILYGDKEEKFEEFVFEIKSAFSE